MPKAVPADADLVQTDRDAWLVLIGAATFVIGFSMTLAFGLEPEGSRMPPPAWLLSAAGAGSMSIATARATKRLRPGISGFEKWKFQSWLSRQWMRPSVLAQSWRIVRGRRS